MQGRLHDGLRRVALWSALAGSLGTGFAQVAAPTDLEVRRSPVEEVPRPSMAPAVLWSRDITIPAAADLGQYLGTLLEVKSRDGRTIASAGFASGSQTRGINDHRSLQVYVEEPVPVAPGTLAGWDRTALGARPYGPTSLFRLANYKGDLIAYPFGAAGPTLRYVPGADQWAEVELVPREVTARLEVVSLQVVDDAALVSFRRDIYFRGLPLDVSELALTDQVAIESVLYANGRLYVAETELDEKRDPVHARLSDCYWRPELRALRDCRRLPFPRGNSLAPGKTYQVLGMHPLATGALLLYGLAGYLYYYEDGQLQPLVDIGEIDGSWQIYSSLEYYGGLLFGMYPSGNLLQLSMSRHLPTAGSQGKGGSVSKPDAGIKPRVAPAGDSRLRAEAQSLMFRGSDLAVGMWPWGEVFAGRPGAEWAIGEPTPLSDDAGPPTQHPFEAAVGSNCVGMRVFQIVPWRGGLVYQLTPKNNDRECWSAFDAVGPEALQPYGRVYYTDVPGALSCAIPWASVPRRVRIALNSDDTLSVSVNGVVTCARPFRNAAKAAVSIRAGRLWERPTVGLYGRRSASTGW